MDKKLLTPVAIYSFIIIAVILTAYSIVGLYVTKGQSVSSLLLKTKEVDQNSVELLVKSVVPNPEGSENVRPYKFEGKEISLSYYNTQEGFNFISYEIDEKITEDSLTPEQKEKINSIASNVFRPCCGVSAATPDCSHGYAARGLIKLLVKEGWSEEQIYDEISMWNRFWWPKHYVGVALYLEQQDKSWEEISSKELLSRDYSTSSASRKIGAALGMSLY